MTMANKDRITDDDLARYRFIKARALWANSDYLQDTSRDMVKRAMLGDTLPAEDLEQVRQAFEEVFRFVEDWPVCRIEAERSLADEAWDAVADWKLCAVNLEKIATELGCTRYELRQWEITVGELV